jgi:hypothetical protein
MSRHEARKGYIMPLNMLSRNRFIEAERLQSQLEGRSLSVEENKQNTLSRLKTLIYGGAAFIKDKLPR